MTLNRTKGNLSQKVKSNIMTRINLVGLEYIDSTKFPKKSLILNQSYLVEEYFNVIFTSSIYNFLNFKLPPDRQVKKYYNKFKNLLLKTNYNLFIKDISRKGISFTIKNLLNDTYGLTDNVLKLKNIYLENIKKFDDYTTFTLRFKDSSGNLFGETQPRPMSVIQNNLAYTIPVLIDDATVTEKTGFNESEDVYIYYYNEYYQKEYLLSINGGNITAELLSVVLIEDVDTSAVNKLDFNPQA